MVSALQQELILRRSVLARTRISSLYFGGGTPSLLGLDALTELFDTLRAYYDLSALSECTLEANPEDINQPQLETWKKLGFNRLSIGVQSFHQPYLDILGRCSSEALNIEACRAARASGFQQISIDLIYGIASNGTEIWDSDLRLALSLEIDHLSAYSLILEPKTMLEHQHKKGIYVPPSEDEVADELDLLHQQATAAGFRHYEIASFARQGAEALHNSNYWRGVKYLGIGPSAHSYDGYKRWHNVSQNTTYIRKLSADELPTAATELLTRSMRWRELLCTSLRTSEGISLLRARRLLGAEYVSFQQKLSPLLEQGLLLKTSTHLQPTYEGLKIADTIALHLLEGF